MEGRTMNYNLIFFFDKAVKCKLQLKREMWIAHLFGYDTS